MRLRRFRRKLYFLKHGTKFLWLVKKRDSKKIYCVYWDLTTSSTVNRRSGTVPWLTTSFPTTHDYLAHPEAVSFYLGYLLLTKIPVPPAQLSVVTLKNREFLRLTTHNTTKMGYEPIILSGAVVGHSKLPDNIPFVRQFWGVTTTTDKGWSIMVPALYPPPR